MIVAKANYEASFKPARLAEGSATARAVFERWTVKDARAGSSWRVIPRYRENDLLAALAEADPTCLIEFPTWEEVYAEEGKS